MCHTMPEHLRNCLKNSAYYISTGQISNTNNIFFSIYIYIRSSLECKTQTNPIWLHFKRMAETSAKCKHCSRTLIFTRYSKSNLKRHMRTQHPLLFGTPEHIASNVTSTADTRLDLNHPRVQIETFKFNMLYSSTDQSLLKTRATTWSMSSTRHVLLRQPDWCGNTLNALVTDVPGADNVPKSLNTLRRESTICTVT